MATLLTGVAFVRVYFFLPNGNHMRACVVMITILLMLICMIYDMVGWGEDQSRVTVTIAICTSLFLIVFVSAVVGTALPLILHAAHIDPAHAGPAVQVLLFFTITPRIEDVLLMIDNIGCNGCWWRVDYMRCMPVIIND